MTAPEKTWGNHPICDHCWIRQNGKREPVRMKTRPWHRCCMCGRHTTSGVFIRVRLDQIPFPTLEHEDTDPRQPNNPEREVP